VLRRFAFRWQDRGCIHFPMPRDSADKRPSNLFPARNSINGCFRGIDGIPSHKTITFWVLRGRKEGRNSATICCLNLVLNMFPASSPMLGASYRSHPLVERLCSAARFDPAFRPCFGRVGRWPAGECGREKDASKEAAQNLTPAVVKH
jgi:hypothetical protein